MAFSLDFDIYNWLLADILKVTPTGDPVNDAVYLVLLPLIVLYMYSDWIIGKSRFVGHAGTLKTVMMLIVGFIIIREGYYPLFAAFSLPLLVIIMILHSFSFILGRGMRGRTTPVAGVGFQEGGGEVEEEKQSALASLAEFVDDVKNPSKFVQKDFYVKLMKDIKRLKTDIDENIETFSGIASSKEGNAKAAEIVQNLRGLRLELTEIERKINDGESIGKVDIKGFRAKLEDVLNSEKA